MNVVFPCCANWETFVADTNVSEQNQKHFFVSRTQNLCLQQMLRAGKRGNICVGNNVSSFARALRDQDPTVTLGLCVKDSVPKIIQKFNYKFLLTQSVFL